jgi:hypothetical protein
MKACDISHAIVDFKGGATVPGKFIVYTPFEQDSGEHRAESSGTSAVPGAAGVTPEMLNKAFEGYWGGIPMNYTDAGEIARRLNAALAAAKSSVT